MIANGSLVIISHCHSPSHHLPLLSLSSSTLCYYVRTPVCACVCARMRVCARAHMCACVRAYMHLQVHIAYRTQKELKKKTAFTAYADKKPRWDESPIQEGLLQVRNICASLSEQPACERASLKHLWHMFKATRVHVRIYAFVQVCAYKCVDLWMCTLQKLCVRTCVHACVRACVRVYLQVLGCDVRVS